MATMIAFTAADPGSIAVAVQYLRTVHSFRRIPMPAAPGYRLAAAAAQPGDGVTAVIVAEHQAAAVRAAGGTVVHLATGTAPAPVAAELVDAVVEAGDDQLLREHLEQILQGHQAPAGALQAA